MKIWIKGDAAHSLTLPVMIDAQTAAVALPNTAFSVKVFGPAITSDNTYVFKPYVGSSEGEEMEVSYKDE